MADKLSKAAIGAAIDQFMAKLVASSDEVRQRFRRDARLAGYKQLRAYARVVVTTEMLFTPDPLTQAIADRIDLRYQIDFVRFKMLRRKRDRGALTPEEVDELAQLTEGVRSLASFQRENRKAAAALQELAKYERKHRRRRRRK